jgi:hypothetical protein
MSGIPWQARPLISRFLFGSLLLPLTALAAQSRDDSAGVLTGQVLNEDSLPIPQAIVELDRKRPMETDLGGHFRLERIPAGSHELVVRMIGFTAETLSVRIDAGARINRVVVLGTRLLDYDRVTSAQIVQSGGRPR